MESLVVLKNVSVQDGQKILLENISAVFNKGQLTTLIGPNGGGKSTLLKLILDVMHPTKGKVHIRKGIKIGYMPQKIIIDPQLPLTVRYFLKNPKILENLNSCDLLDLNMATLSGGEMQRVLLAYALQDNPDLLLLDEPTQGLDMTGERQLYELIFDYQAKTNCCIVMASHDLNVVLARSDQVLCLNGHLCCQGHPDALRHHKGYQDLFEKVSYTHHHDHIHCLSGEIKDV
ncbi:MAG: ATP-binding cassette domain-containing protein [Alphaproteobacteria bacterium]